MSGIELGVPKQFPRALAGALLDIDCIIVLIHKANCPSRLQSIESAFD